MTLKDLWYINCTLMRTVIWFHRINTRSYSSGILTYPRAVRAFPLKSRSLAAFTRSCSRKQPCSWKKRHQIFFEKYGVGYLDYLTVEKGFAPATRNNRLAALRAFASYASACFPEYMALENELSAIKLQKDDPFSKVDYMSENAVKALLNEPDTEHKRTAIEKAMSGEHSGITDATPCTVDDDDLLKKLYGM